MRNFGIKLKTLRTNKQLTQKELANIIGVTIRTIISWENNLTKPNIARLYKISKFFNVRANFLVGLDTF